MSNQGPDRRRHHGHIPDPSRRAQQSAAAGPPWEIGDYPDAAAWPGATGYQDPAAYQDPAPYPGERSYQDRYQAADASQDRGGASRYVTRQRATYRDGGSGDGQTYPGGTDGRRTGYPDPAPLPGSGYPEPGYRNTGYAEPHPSGPQPLEPHPSGPQPRGPHPSGPQPSAQGYRQPGARSYQGDPSYRDPGVFAGAGGPARGYAGYPDTGPYQEPAGFQAPVAEPFPYQEPAAFQAPVADPFPDQNGFPGQAPAQTTAYQPAEEHPSLPGVKLADLAAPDPTAYQGLEGYLRGTGPGGGAVAGGWRRGRGILTGIATGLLAGGVAIGVAILAAAFVRPQASPVIAIGDALLGRASARVFGPSDKLILLAAIYAVIAVLAMAIGLLARRRLAGGVTGMAALGAFGAFVALTRPESHATDVIPSLTGGAAGVAALVLLVRAGSPQVILAAAVQRGRGGYRRAAEPEVVGTNRRNFLLAGATAAGAAVVAGVAGKVLGKQALSTGGSGNAVAIPAPLQKAPPLQPGAELTVPGISPFYTPNASFYRVDTALVVPQLTTASWQLRIHGMVEKTITINYDDLIKRPQIQRDITIVCVSESVGGGYIGNARWQGTLLAPLLREAGVHPGATQIVMRDVQGMAIGVSTQAVMDGRDAMLAVSMNGEPLPAEHGFPVRVVIPGLYGYVSACKWVVDMELTTYPAYSAYWVKRGWSEQAEVKTESRIDTPKTGKALTAGPVVIGGVAWAQHKGIARVEVGIDGVWQAAALATQDTIDTWRQWYYRWNATPGAHTIQVRATDQTGYTQTAVVHEPLPNGATGYHTIQVNVA